MSFAKILFSLTIFFVLTLKGEFKILMPPDKSITETSEIWFVAEIPDTFDSLMLEYSKEKNTYPFKELEENEGIFHHKLDLKIKENVIKFTLFYNKKKEQKAVSVFYQPIIANRLKPSKRYKPLKFHNIRSAPCEECHSFDFEEVENKDELSCYDCHKNMFVKKHLHPAFDSPECNSCHNTDKFTLIEKIPDLCFECHDEDEFNGKYKHGPVTAGECLLCHNPHSSNYPSLLFDSINNVCETCHSNYNNHPIVGHPVKGVPDPRVKGKELSCVSCHKPHNSSYKYFLFAEPGQLCIKCHQNKR